MEPTDQNRRAWDEVHRRRAEASTGRAGLPAIVRKTLGDLAKKRVLHLQCATGEASAELAELGAVVTGVDFSEEALDAARERWPKILWIEADVQSLPAKLRRGRFDLVYSAEGVLAGLDDLDAWATGIVAALHPLGELLMFEEHPVAECVDGLLRWHRDYFGTWRLGQVVTALARAGLVVEALEEYPGDSSWRRHDKRIPGTFMLYARRKP
ncbi:MAG TPA: class I SAM-dependent methyltransferase [Gaiellaceae bacterium]|jgi:SAM-dependent methyltransferase|nr:class I SAM-dependent methyltransferase [Gaiellaceae bacterium]